MEEPIKIAEEGFQKDILGHFHRFETWFGTTRLSTVAQHKKYSLLEIIPRHLQMVKVKSQRLGKFSRILGKRAEISE